MPVHGKEVFEGVDYSGNNLAEGRFDNCVFRNCNFQKCDLRDADFTDCTFTDCNFSLATLSGTTLNKVKFTGCKLVGLDFSKCNNFLFSTSFQGCNLDYASFFKRKMKKTRFVECSLREVDFEEADASLSVFDNCELAGAKFMYSVLEEADFSTARNYVMDPEKNKIKKAKFSLYGLEGLLAKYGIVVE